MKPKKMPEVYEPQEDSFLLRKYVRDYAKGNVLDVGTGSGIQAIAASAKADNVIAVDINENALQFAQTQANAEKIKNIEFRKSDLFSKVKEKFDLIIFNPPYLPHDNKEPEEIRLFTTGGKEGCELLIRFLEDANEHLTTEGVILTVFSSLSNKQKIDFAIAENCLAYKEIDAMRFSFETIYVYVIQKSKLRKELEENNVANIKKLAKGHRGIIYTGVWQGKKIAAKSKLPGSMAMGNIEREAGWLRTLNRFGIGPKLLYSEHGYFVYKFVEGKFINDYIEKTKGKTKIKKVIKKVFEQCFIMDEHRINKEEMHHPYKHIIVKGEKVTLIDFERGNHTDKPHNVTQFCQAIMNGRIGENLRKKGFKINKNKIINLAREYSKNNTRENLEAILDAIR
jgi:release factor glutamine methyltransferase